MFAKYNNEFALKSHDIYINGQGHGKQKGCAYKVCTSERTKPETSSVAIIIISKEISGPKKS